MSNILEVKGISKYYYIKEGFLRRKTSMIRAVEDVSLKVKEGETFGIAGESGSGKSTLCMCIAKLLQPDKGRLYIEGKEYTNAKGKELREVRSRIQVVFQNPASSLDPHMRVKDIILEPVKSLTKEQDNELAKKLLSDVGLPEYLSNRFPHELSGGMMQRVAIARAISIKPKIVILDEPTSALDASIQAQMLNLFNKIQEEHNITYILVSHDLSVIGHMCDEIAIMYAGRIVEFGTFDDIFYNPKHPYTLALLSSSRIPGYEGLEKEVELRGEIPSPRNPPRGCTLHPRCPFASSICKGTYPEPFFLSERHFATCYNINKVETLTNSHRQV
jgi:oligopeptide/dipeptide ABC transporter ATP-binding protein